MWDLRGKLAADEKALDLDLVDFVDMMLATGLRIGETAAITWPAVDLELGSVEVRGTVIRVRGEGLVIKPKPQERSGLAVDTAAELVHGDAAPSSDRAGQPVGGRLHVAHGAAT